MIVYIGMVGDGIHHGHINLIKKGQRYGRVIIGLLTDEAVESYKRKTILKYKERKFIFENIKGVWKIVPQKTLDYVPNIMKYLPDIVLHGNDWKKGVQKETRERAKDAVKSYGGRLIDIPYTKGISTTQYIKRIIENGKKKSK